MRLITIFGIILFLCILVSIILVVVFSRDDPDAKLITKETWDRLPEARQTLKYLPKTDQLLSIWTDPNPIHPRDLIRGDHQEIHQKFASMGYSNCQQGIVIAAGGFHYFASAYVLIRELRHHQCTLPIELWYCKDELGADHIEHMKQFGVVCLDINRYVPFKIQHKFSIKVIAMYVSSFEEILFLDADNNVLRDPSYLFASPAYQESHALFWPDYWPLNRDAPCYANFPEGVEPRLNTFQQESGQMVIDKGRYWPQLWYVLRILENGLEGLFPAPFNFGDKDVFHITWNACNQPFHFVQHRVKSIADRYHNAKRKQVHTIAMGQSDPDGQLLFIHQNHAEWGDRKPNSNPWWKLVKEHTHPTQGFVEAGIWNPVGPTRTFDFRQEHGTIEDQYLMFILELRQQGWYQEFYHQELSDRGFI